MATSVATRQCLILSVYLRRKCHVSKYIVTEQFRLNTIKQHKGLNVIKAFVSSCLYLRTNNYKTFKVFELYLSLDAVKIMAILIQLFKSFNNTRWGNNHYWLVMPVYL